MSILKRTEWEWYSGVFRHHLERFRMESMLCPALFWPKIANQNIVVTCRNQTYRRDGHKDMQNHLDKLLGNTCSFYSNGIKKWEYCWTSINLKRAEMGIELWATGLLVVRWKPCKSQNGDYSWNISKTKNACQRINRWYQVLPWK